MARCYNAVRILVEVVVQTRGQPAWDQSAIDVGGGAGCYGLKRCRRHDCIFRQHPEKNAGPVLSTDTSANALQEYPAPCQRLALLPLALVSTRMSASVQKSMNIHKSVIVHHLGATPPAGIDHEVTGSLGETGSCPSVEGAVRDAYSAFLRVPPQRYPTGQLLVYGDLSGSTISVNEYSHQ